MGFDAMISGGSGMLGIVPLYEKRHMYIEVGTILSTPVLSRRFGGGMVCPMSVDGQGQYIAA